LPHPAANKRSRRLNLSPDALLGAATGAAEGIIVPDGDVNSAVGHGRVTHREAQRVALRRAAQAELARSGLRLGFGDPLETLYEVDQTPARVRELQQVVRLGIAIYVVLAAVISFLVVRHPAWSALALQLTLAPAASWLIGRGLFRQGMSAPWREAGVTASCCGYSLATIISVSLGPPQALGSDLFLVALPVIGVLFFARQPFWHAVFFTAFSLAGLLAVLLLHPALPVGLRAYPMVFLLAVAIPALLGVYRLEQSARRVWLLRLLQSLRVDDLASENVELSEQAAAALQASEERLRRAQKMEAVGQLTGGIAHDFNNLLTTIIGSLELLSQRGGLDTASERLAANALAGAERGARLTGQLLAFSRRQLLAPARQSPSAVVEGIGELLARTLGETIELRVRPAASGQWDVLADRNQLEMALLNLVINARDAIGGKGGRVEIKFANLYLTAPEAAALTGEPIAPGDYVRISVTDTGAGMPPDVLARACEPFFTTKPAGAGTGLGLSQTYGFATQSGGTLLIDSTPGKGTRVSIVLPRAHAHESVAPSPKAAPRRAQGETILVVEDDALARATVHEALINLGYKVATAANADAALQTIRSDARLDLLLTDIIMPGGLGGVALALQARQHRPRLPVLFTTGYGDGGVAAQWPGTPDIMQKPFNTEELANRVAACLHAAPAEMCDSAEAAD
jgi:signal transduction histidine kinase/CheY-like chemotaxis protein